MIEIDGSFGEGGGQILRTSLSLSLVTGKAFHIGNIRAKRKRPGLLRQHLAAVLAAAEVGQAKVEGAILGSTDLSFVPGSPRSGDYRFAIGTAGSATLVFQTVLPVLLTTPGPSRVTVEGGTYNEAAPPFDFIKKTFLPLIERMGPKVTIEAERYGFYPAGGGRIVASISPGPFTPLVLPERGEITSHRITAIVSNLPRHIAEREVHTANRILEYDRHDASIEETKNAFGPGNVVLIELASAHVTEVFSAVGKLGVSAENVAGDAAREARVYIQSRAAAGEHLTDQLLLPMVISGGGSFTAQSISVHTRTNAAVIQMFAPVAIDIAEEQGYYRVRVSETEFSLPYRRAREAPQTGRPEQG